MDKQSVIHPTTSHPFTPPTLRRCVGWKTAKPFPRVTSRLLATNPPLPARTYKVETQVWHDEHPMVAVSFAELQALLQP